MKNRSKIQFREGVEPARISHDLTYQSASDDFHDEPLVKRGRIRFILSAKIFSKYKFDFPGKYSINPAKTEVFGKLFRRLALIGA